MQYGADKIKVDDNFLNEMKKDVTKELSDVEVFDEAWNSSISSLLAFHYENIMF